MVLAPASCSDSHSGGLYAHGVSSAHVLCCRLLPQPLERSELQKSSM